MWVFTICNFPISNFPIRSLDVYMFIDVYSIQYHYKRFPYRQFPYKPQLLKDEGYEKVTIKLPPSELGCTSRFWVRSQGVPSRFRVGLGKKVPGKKSNFFPAGEKKYPGKKYPGKRTQEEKYPRDEKGLKDEG